MFVNLDIIKDIEIKYNLECNKNVILFINN